MSINDLDSSSVPASRMYALLVIYLMLVIALVTRAADVTIGNSVTDYGNLQLLSIPPRSMQKLNAHTVELEEMTKNIDEYAFAQIRKQIEKTIRLTNIANRELAAQQQAWLEVKEDMRDDTTTLLSMRKEVSNLQALQDDEILHLKALLQKVEKPSITRNLIDFFITFGLGVFSSLLATMFVSHFKNRKKHP